MRKLVMGGTLAASLVVLGSAQAGMYWGMYWGKEQTKETTSMVCTIQGQDGSTVHALVPSESDCGNIGGTVSHRVVGLTGKLQRKKNDGTWGMYW